MRTGLAAAAVAACLALSAAPAARADEAGEAGEAVISELADLKSEAKDLSLELEAYKAAMADRIRYFYEETAGTGLLGSLLSSGGFAEMIRRAELQAALYRYDLERLREFEALAAEADRKEAELEAKEAEAAGAVEALSDAPAGIRDAAEDGVPEEPAKDAQDAGEEARDGAEDAEAGLPEAPGEELPEDNGGPGREDGADAPDGGGGLAEDAEDAPEEEEPAQEEPAESGEEEPEEREPASPMYEADAEDFAGLSYGEAQYLSAERISSVLRAAGWTDEMVAGALGNMEVESGFDFTSVEWLSYHCSEYFSWGPEKQAWADADYIMADLNPSYSFSKVYRAGIGLIGWTDTTDGATGNTDLREYAERNGTAWYGLDIQLQFLLDAGGGDTGRARTILGLRGSGAEDTPAGWAYWWAVNIEGCTYDLAKRQSCAQEWYERLQDVPYDEGYALGILAAAGA